MPAQITIPLGGQLGDTIALLDDLITPIVVAPPLDRTSAHSRPGAPSVSAHRWLVAFAESRQDRPGADNTRWASAQRPRPLVPSRPPATPLASPEAGATAETDPT